jgi:spore coat protein CotH
MTPRRAFTLTVLSLLVLGSSPASAQTASDVFSTAVLHDVSLRMNSRDLELLRATYDQNTYYPADLQWGQTVVRNVAIRSRGRASRSDVKLGLRVDMDHFVSGQTFVGLDALVLDNLNQDPSMIHEHAAMALFERLGQVVPRTSFARLFINDEYQGVYGLVEEPNENFVEERLARTRDTSSSITGWGRTTSMTSAMNFRSMRAVRSADA